MENKTNLQSFISSFPPLHLPFTVCRVQCALCEIILLFIIHYCEWQTTNSHLLGLFRDVMFGHDIAIQINHSMFCRRNSNTNDEALECVAAFSFHALFQFDTTGNEKRVKGEKNRRKTISLNIIIFSFPLSRFSSQ